jgi:hypothetical protein
VRPTKRKKMHFQRNLGSPNTFPRERVYLFASKNLIETSNIKLPFVRRRTPKLIFRFASHSNGIQQGEEGSQDVHLPVVGCSKKANIPLKGTTLQYQVSCNERILITSYAKQNRESFLEGHLSTPHIVPNLILNPFPKINLVLLENKLHPFLEFFHHPSHIVLLDLLIKIHLSRFKRIRFILLSRLEVV